MSIFIHCDNPICHRKVRAVVGSFENKFKVPDGWKDKSQIGLGSSGTFCLQLHFCPKHSAEAGGN